MQKTEMDNKEYCADNAGFSSELDSIPSNNKPCGDSSRTSSLPTPTLLQDLRTKAQKSQSTNLEYWNSVYAPHHTFLPEHSLLHHHHQRQHPEHGDSPSALLSISEPLFDSSCSTHLLGSESRRQPFCSSRGIRFKSHQELCLSSSAKKILHLPLCPSLRLACMMVLSSFVVAMVCAVVAVFVNSTTPCEDLVTSKDGHTWWKGAVFYEIFPASFQDTDGDGFGDLRGIIKRLDYIRNLGVSGIRLSSVFSALDYPLEYEHIIDFENVDPHLGRMEDFRELVREAHMRGMRVILDLNPSVTSDQHTWALHWQRGIPGYEHYYASANRSKAPPEMEDNDGPPESEWELPQRTFGGHYVLNWSSPSVQREFSDMLDFWLDSGVDGFYMKHMDKMHVHSDVELYLIISQWRRQLNRARLPHASHKVLITSVKFADHVSSSSAVLELILEQIDLLDIPLYINTSTEIATQFVSAKTWRTRIRNSPWILWHLGSAETFRFSSRIEPDFQAAALFLLMMLPGSMSIFYGDEIGMKDSYDVITGKVFRGGQLTPMQWTEYGAGDFTGNDTLPWLPLHPDHETLNAQVQESRIRFLMQLMKLRQGTMDERDCGAIPFVDTSVITLQRTCDLRKSRSGLLFAANFGSLPQRRNFSRIFPSFSEMDVLLTSTKNRGRVSLDNVMLDSGEAIVAKLII